MSETIPEHMKMPLIEAQQKRIAELDARLQNTEAENVRLLDILSKKKRRNWYHDWSSP